MARRKSTARRRRKADVEATPVAEMVEVEPEDLKGEFELDDHKTLVAREKANLLPTPAIESIQDDMEMRKMAAYAPVEKAETAKQVIASMESDSYLGKATVAFVVALLGLMLLISALR